MFPKEPLIENMTYLKFKNKNCSETGNEEDKRRNDRPKNDLQEINMTESHVL